MHKLAIGLVLLSSAFSATPAHAKSDTRGPAVNLSTACPFFTIQTLAVCVAPSRGECQQIIAYVRLNGGTEGQEWIPYEEGCEKLNDGSGLWEIRFHVPSGDAGGTNTGGGGIG